MMNVCPEDLTNDGKFLWSKLLEDVKDNTSVKLAPQRLLIIMRMRNHEYVELHLVHHLLESTLDKYEDLKDFIVNSVRYSPLTDIEKAISEAEEFTKLKFPRWYKGHLMHTIVSSKECMIRISWKFLEIS